MGGQGVRMLEGHYEASLDLKETQELVGRLCEFVYVFCATSSTKISKRT